MAKTIADANSCSSKHNKVMVVCIGLTLSLCLTMTGWATSSWSRSAEAMEARIRANEQGRAALEAKIDAMNSVLGRIDRNLEKALEADRGPKP